MKLNELFKNTSYDDTLFSSEAITTIEKGIFTKNIKGKEVPYFKCLVREKDIKLTPEEAIRQLYIWKLVHDYGYPTSRIQLETPIHFGREVKRADITIMDKDRPMVPYIIVELKKPKLTDGKEQLKSYCNATGAPIGVWTNGEQVSCYNRKDPNFFEMISDIPQANQKLSEILSEKYTYDDLRSRDKISKEKRSLRNLIKEMEDEVLASAGVDSFEEIFKLIFAKLYDELICANDKTAYLKFRNSGDTDFELKEKIQGLFDDREGRKMIMENYPEYYFWDFYRANEDFEYTYRDVPPDKSECLIVGMKMNRNRGTKWSFVITGFVRLFGKHYGVEYNENVQFACNISDVLSQSTDYISKHPKTSEQDYLSWILREINSEVSHSIIQAFKEHYEHTTYASRQLTKIQSLEKRALSIIWSIFTLNAKDDSNKTYDEMIRSRNSYEVIRQNPLNYFEYHMEVDLQPNRVLTASEESWYKKLYETRNQNSVIWFLSFVYRLRNALFHEIIDPLNEEWQLIFKNAYLVLKEIVDLNISEIGKTAIAENSVV